MAQHTMIAAMRMFAAALGLTVVCGVAAQSPAVSPKEADQARQQAAQQLSQPLNNQPVWNEIRTGEPQYTSIPGRETNVLVQPQGQTWRAVRTPIATFGGMLLAVVLLGLAGFYAWRGQIVLHGKSTGRMIERFAPLKRYTHWTMAWTFVALAVSGMILTFGKTVLLPLIGATLFSWLAILAKNLHNFTGPIFSVALLIFIVLFVRDNLPRAYDLKWIAKFGGMLDRGGNTHVPSGKFNAGEKALFWILVVVLCVVLSVTGYILNFPNFNQTRATMQIANVVHMSVALLAIAMACFHIYLGTVGMAGALDAMRTGYVDETWAKEHHEYWYNDVKAGRIPSTVAADPAGQYAS
jgi:formate dehydrogenase subunit gamma